MKQLKTDPIFQSLIPPLSDSELQRLEESILSLGRCRDPLKVWKDTIIDGHNRYAICQKHNIPFRLQKVNFASKKDAELWIVQNQLGRRNLTNVARIKLVLHMETLLKEKAKLNRKGCQGAPVHRRKVMAKAATVSERTMYWFTKVRLHGTPELMQKVESGELSIFKAYCEATGNTGAKPPPQAPALEVTTREVWYDDSTADISHPICRMNMLRSAQLLVKILGFLRDNVAVFCGCEELSRIRRKVWGVLSGVRGCVLNGNLSSKSSPLT